MILYRIIELEMVQGEFLIYHYHWGIFGKDHSIGVHCLCSGYCTTLTSFYFIVCIGGVGICSVLDLFSVWFIMDTIDTWDFLELCIFPLMSMSACMNFRQLILGGSYVISFRSASIQRSIWRGLLLHGLVSLQPRFCVQSPCTQILRSFSTHLGKTS